MAPKILVLPNVVRNAVAPNTLSGMSGAHGTAPATAPRAAPVRVTARQLWRIALFAGFGLALLVTLIAGRPW